MSKHSKNNCSGAVFTYHERQQLKYGTISQRLGQDSMKEFDSCALCLQPVIEPLSCREGHLFCKECVFNYLLDRKQELQRQTAKYEEQQQRLASDEARKEEENKAKEIEHFDRMSGQSLPPSNARKAILTQKKEEPKKMELRSFWVPGVGENIVAEDVIKKPPSEVSCPESNHPLRLKQLIKVILTPVSTKTENEKGRYQCPSCCRVLTKSVKTDCGHVLCNICHDKTKQDSQCFVCSKKFKDRHVIKVQTGGTGYSGGTGEKLTAKIVTATAWV